jgi:hypothetical protein
VICNTVTSYDCFCFVSGERGHAIRSYILMLGARVCAFGCVVSCCNRISVLKQINNPVRAVCLVRLASIAVHHLVTLYIILCCVPVRRYTVALKTVLIDIIQISRIWNTRRTQQCARYDRGIKNPYQHCATQPR